MHTVFGAMSAKLESLGIEVQQADLQHIPLDTRALPLEEAKAIIRPIDAFEDDDDVQGVFHNLELTDELVQHLER